MKKFAFLVLFALAGSLFLASCSGGDDDTTVKPKPTVTWKTTAGFKFADGSEQAGNNISFGVLATPSSGEKITRVKISLSVNGGVDAVLFDSTMKENSYNRDWLDIALGQLTGSKNRFTATVTQSNGESASVAFIITATAPKRNVQTTNAIMLGAQNTNVAGSFFNPAQGATGVMLFADANSDQSNVHIVYYSGANNKESFASPSDATVVQVFAQVANWTKRNVTNLRKTTMTAADFDNIDPADATEIDNQCTSGVFTTLVNQLKVGDVIAYRTQTGNHYALFKVTAINAGSTGTITFDMKNPAF